MEQKIKPGKAWFILPTLVLLAGIVCAAVFGGMAAKAVNAPAVRFTLPGESQIKVQRAGPTGIYCEFDTGARRYYYDAESWVATITFRHVERNEVVESEPVWYYSNYQFGTRRGVLVAQVDFPYAGTYAVTSDFKGTFTEPQVHLVVGNPALDFAIPFVFAMLCGLGGLFAGGILYVVLLVMRSSAKKRLNAPPPPPFYPMQAPAYYYYGGAPYYYPPPGWGAAPPSTPPGYGAGAPPYGTGAPPPPEAGPPPQGGQWPPQAGQ
ncbi:MAG: hypothetical protein AB7V55_01595 [Oscillospiraceae bacterium]